VIEKRDVVVEPSKCCTVTGHGDPLVFWIERNLTLRAVPLEGVGTITVVVAKETI
jgi:hypothetical protein